LLGLLDQAKGFALVAQQYPEAVRQIEHVSPRNVCFYRDFQVTVEEVFSGPQHSSPAWQSSGGAVWRDC
jgi:pyoverdine/dityrosine biosynthesis protein Dit1